MTGHHTHRVLVSKTELFTIDVAAHNDEQAISRARFLWNCDMKHRFDVITADEPLTFQVDHHATCQLADIADEDRARYALSALRAFADVTGSQVDREAVRDLLTDLGYYADRSGLDFEEELRRACQTLAREKAEEVQS